MAEQKSGEEPAKSAMEERRTEEATPRAVCQICGGRLIEIRGKLQCERCHTIWETCCEGGRW
jgi:hypothetical protein